MKNWFLIFCCAATQVLSKEFSMLFNHLTCYEKHLDNFGVCLVNTKHKWTERKGFYPFSKQSLGSGAWIRLGLHHCITAVLFMSRFCCSLAPFEFSHVSKWDMVLQTSISFLQKMITFTFHLPSEQRKASFKAVKLQQKNSKQLHGKCFSSEMSECRKQQQKIIVQETQQSSTCHRQTLCVSSVFQDFPAIRESLFRIKRASLFLHWCAVSAICNFTQQF